MKILIMGSSLTSLIYMCSSHPVLLMLLILTQTSLICVAAWMKLKVGWFSYILFLIFLGGLMVLFVYITSLASNEMMNIKMEIYSNLLMASGVIMAFLAVNMNFQHPVEETAAIAKTFYFMYSWNLVTIILLTMIYLLLTLIIVVKISNKFEAPIKNMIYN